MKYNFIPSPSGQGRMGSPDRPSKKDAFLALLREGWTSLHLDARRAGVIVPDHLKGEAHLVLQYGHDLPIPIPDLTVDEHGVAATLSFSRMPQYTVVPWTAVYVVASEDGRGVLYSPDVPDDVRVVAMTPESDGAPVDGVDAEGTTTELPAPDAPATGPTATGRNTPRTLRAVPPADDDVPMAREAVARGMESSGVSPRKRRPQLRLVK
jgi:stringent starvation protein B